MEKTGQKELGDDGGVGYTLLFNSHDFPEVFLTDTLQTKMSVDFGESLQKIGFERTDLWTLTLPCDANLATKAGEFSPRRVENNGEA